MKSKTPLQVSDSRSRGPDSSGQREAIHKMQCTCFTLASLGVTWGGVGRGLVATVGLGKCNPPSRPTANGASHPESHQFWLCGGEKMRFLAVVADAQRSYAPTQRPSICGPRGVLS